MGDRRQSRISLHLICSTVLLAGAVGMAAPALAEKKPTSIEIQFVPANASAGADSSKTIFGDRIFSRKDDKLIVSVSGCNLGSGVNFKFEEKERATRLQQDIVTAAKKITSKSGDDCPQYSGEWTIQHTRATLKISAVNDEDKEVAVRNLVLGPVERLSLGLNLPVNNRSTLKYDADTKSLVPKDDAPQFYLSLNIAGSDVWLDPKYREGPLDNLELKLLVAANSHPLDNYGIALGYKLPAFSQFDLEGISIFAGYFRIKEDRISGTTPQAGAGRTSRWRFGVSYDLSTAINWLKL